MDKSDFLVPVDLINRFFPVVEALDQVGIRYHIGGSVASSTWGLPRSTQDADIIVDMQLEHVAPFVSRNKHEHSPQSD